MNALTEIQPQSQSSAFSALMLELAKCLKLVAPISMSADAQMVWLQAAVDALEGIHAHEVAAISAELRRSVTRPSQIVPEIARLVTKSASVPIDRRSQPAPTRRKWRSTGIERAPSMKAHGDREKMDEALRVGTPGADRRRAACSAS
jgi:hypothetical protein